MTRPNQHHQRTWSATETDLLKRMWWDGHRAETIAIAIHATSAACVAEKAHREGFKRNPELKLNAQPSLFEIPQLRLPAMRAGGELVTVGNVQRQECRWIEGDEAFADAPMCGRSTEGGPWCCEHRKRVYQSVKLPAMELPRYAR